MKDEITKKLLKRIDLIEQRNNRVESEKAWETSSVRKIGIAVLTYLIVSSFFVVIKVESPFVNAIVPTLGFLLSTLSLSVLKKVWIKSQKTK